MPEQSPRLTAYKTEFYQPWATPETKVEEVHITSPPIAAKEEVVKVVMQSKQKPYGVPSKLFAEFIGTLLFVFMGSMSGKGGGDGVTHAAFAHGFTIFVLVCSLGHISGGHFNPAVTWAVAVSNKMSLFMVPAYWAAQLLGGFVGSLIARASLQKEEFAQIGAGATLLSPGELWHQGLIVETMLTLILTQTVLNAAVDTSDNMLAPLAIGLTVALDIFSAGSISGASMNPARSLGPSIAGSIFVEGNGSVFWTYHYIYWAGPLLGATISAGVYRLLFSRGSRLIS